MIAATTFNVFAVILGVAVFSVTAYDTSVNCIYSSSDQPVLQPKSSTVTMAGNPVSTYCFKSVRYSKTTQQSSLNVSNVQVIYLWSVMDFSVMAKMVSCGDVLESSKAVRSRDGSVTMSYTRYCTCCGAKCNDKSMDDQCSEMPAFTHECFSAGWDEIIKHPNLPENAIKVPATSTQGCYKGSMRYPHHSETDHAWGAVGFTHFRCGRSRHEYWLDAYYQGCSCCYDSCNGHTMDNFCNSSTRSYAMTASRLLILLSSVLFTASVSKFV